MQLLNQNYSKTFAKSEKLVHGNNNTAGNSSDFKVTAVMKIENKIKIRQQLPH